ncbi:hypothetical protein ACFSFY_12415 [Sporosarcina siberiensis]|uniref:Uncharacterized protein n=1 Tax=Sporosarcina siberiensis TaxID=1365606 RepID=A0ABW4SIB7_9BACL
MHIQADRNAIYNNSVTRTTNAPISKQPAALEKGNPTDVVELSKTNQMMKTMLSTDKGTAANTTLFVDNATFQKIATYSTNHPDTKWSEIGVDEDKRWIVINGQRFESPISEEEKAMSKRAQMTLMDHLQEYEDRIEETKPKEQVTLDFLTDNANAKANGNPKIHNLLQNEPVMDMLKNISKGSKGKISVSF